MKYVLNGREVSREEWLRNAKGIDEVLASGVTGLGQSSAGWPMRSVSCGVHPSQREQAIEDARRRGVPTDFDERGRAIFTDPGHRKRYARAIGFQDLSENNISRIERD